MGDDLSPTGGGGGGDSSGIGDEMGDPVEFPEDSANEVRDAADWLDIALAATRQTGVPAVVALEGIISVIKSILGDHTVARDLAIVWGTCTAPADVSRDLVSAKAELDSYWEGSAKEGFNTYFSNVEKSLDVAKEKFAEMSTTLVDSVRYIYATSGEAIDFLIDCAAEVVGWNPYETQAAISSLMNRVGDLTSSSMATTGDFDADATIIKTLPSQLTVPADLPGAIDNPDEWDIRPQS